MEIFKLLIIFVLVITITSCRQSIVIQKKEALTRYDTEEYSIIQDTSNSIAPVLLKDSTISAAGSSLFKGIIGGGEILSPFCTRYNDPEGLNIKINVNEDIKIAFFRCKYLGECKYCGIIKIRAKEYPNEVLRIPKSDIEKVFPDDPYRIIIFRNNIPTLRYHWPGY